MLGIESMDVIDRATFNSALGRVVASQKQCAKLQSKLDRYNSVLEQANLPPTSSWESILQMSYEFSTEAAEDKKRLEACSRIMNTLGFGSVAHKEKMAKELTAAADLKKQMYELKNGPS